MCDRNQSDSNQPRRQVERRPSDLDSNRTTKELILRTQPTESSRNRDENPSRSKEAMLIEDQGFRNRSPGFQPDEIRAGEPAVLDIENSIEARIEINYDPNRPLHLRDILVTIFELALEIDPAVTIGSFDLPHVWAQPQEIPRRGLEDLLKKRVRQNKNHTTLIAYLRVYTSKKLLDIANTNPLRGYLRSNGIWLKNEEFGARPVSTVGFFTHIHPTYTRYTTFVENLRLRLRTVEADSDEREQWLRERPDSVRESVGAGNPVPLFTVYKARRSIKLDSLSSTVVLNVRCATEDRAWLGHILCRLSHVTDHSEAKFICQGTLTSGSYATQIRKQNEFLDSCLNIPLVGLSSMAENALVPSNGQMIPLGEFILEMTRAHSLENTNRTEDLGKYFLIARKDALDETMSFLDRMLPDFYKAHIDERLMQRGFPYPRRSNQPLFKTQQDREYLDQLHNEIPPNGFFTDTSLNKKFNEVIIVNDDDPPPQKIRRRSEFESPSSASKYGKGQDAITDLAAKLEALESKINNLSGLNPTETPNQQITQLQNNQKSAIAALERRMESEISNIQEQHKIAMESNQRFFIDQVKKCREDFSQDIQSQAIAFREQLTVHSDGIRREIHDSQERSRVQLLSDIAGLMQMNRIQPAQPDHHHQQATLPHAMQPHLLTPEPGMRNRDNRMTMGAEQMVTGMDSEMSQANHQTLISTTTTTNSMSAQTGTHTSISELTYDTTNKINMKTNKEQIMMNATEEDLCHEARLEYE